MEKLYFALAIFASLLGVFLLMDKTKIVADNIVAFTICVAVAVFWLIDALKLTLQKSSN